MEIPGEFGSIATQPHSAGFKAKLCALPRVQGALGAAESCVLSTASSHCTRVSFLSPDHTQACGRHCETKLTLAFGDGYAGSGRNSVMVCKREEKRAMPCCRAQGRHYRATASPMVHVKKEAPFICCGQETCSLKTQCLSEAHLLTVCEGETEEEMLTAVGK